MRDFRVCICGLETVEWKISHLFVNTEKNELPNVGTALWSLPDWQINANCLYGILREIWYRATGFWEKKIFSSTTRNRSASVHLKCWSFRATSYEKMWGEKNPGFLQVKLNNKWNALSYEVMVYFSFATSSRNVRYHGWKIHSYNKKENTKWLLQLFTVMQVDVWNVVCIFIWMG